MAVYVSHVVFFSLIISWCVLYILVSDKAQAHGADFNDCDEILHCHV